MQWLIKYQENRISTDGDNQVFQNFCSFKWNFLVGQAFKKKERMMYYRMGHGCRWGVLHHEKQRFWKGLQQINNWTWKNSCDKDGWSNPWRHKQKVMGRLGKAFLLFSIALFSKGIFSWVKKGVTRTKVWNVKPRMKERKVKLKHNQISHF